MSREKTQSVREIERKTGGRKRKREMMKDRMREKEIETESGERHRKRERGERQR